MTELLPVTSCSNDTMYIFVTPRLALGATIANRDDLRRLLAEGVTHILNLQIEHDDRPLLNEHAPEISYLDAGVWDDWEPKPVDWFRQGIEFALAALEAPHHRVYVHCAAGISRSSSMLYAILRALRFPASDARQMIEDVRDVEINYAEDAERAIVVLGYCQEQEPRKTFTL